MRTRTNTRLKKHKNMSKNKDNEKLTFGELLIGDKFISVPVPGDNAGHGGYKGAHYLFMKIGIGYSENAVNVGTGTVSDMPLTMEVILIK